MGLTLFACEQSSFQRYDETQWHDHRDRFEGRIPRADERASFGHFLRLSIRGERLGSMLMSCRWDVVGVDALRLTR